MNRIVYTLVLLAIFQKTAVSQVKYSNEFLAIGVGAGAQGMSNAQVAHVSDLTAGYWNPAGLTQIESPFVIGAMHAEWFAGIAQYDWLAFGKKLNQEKSSFLSFSLIRLGIDHIPYTLNLVSPDGTINYDNVTEFSAADYAFLTSYGQRAFHKNLSVGGSLKIVRRVIGQIGNAWGFGADLGAQWRSGRWQFGVQGRDLTTTFNAWRFNLTDDEKAVFQKTQNEIPSSNLEITRPKFILGGAYRTPISKKYSLLTAFDLDWTTDGQRNVLVSTKHFNLDPHVGIELDYNQFLQLRAGVGNFQRIKNELDATKKSLSAQPNFGLGLKIGRLKLDYALTNIGNVSQVLYSNIFSATLALKERKRE